MKYKVMLPEVGNEQDLDKKDFIFEPKLDGIRALCYVNKDVKLYTRNSNDITGQFPELVISEAVDAKSCVLDGEIIVYDADGNPDFSLLEGRDRLASSLAIRMRIAQHPATFVVFDILEKNGKSLTNKPLSERKEILEQTVKSTNTIQVVPYTKDGHTLWKEILHKNIDGVIAKNSKSIYQNDKRNSDWLKITRSQSLNCIIIGYTQQQEVITSLALGAYDAKNKLRYLGKVGIGLDDKTKEYLHPLLKKTSTTETLFKNAGKEITWVKPNLVCEVRYTEITKSKRLENPVFLRLRKGKVEECTLPT